MRHRRTKLLLKFSKNKNGNHLPFLIFVKIKMDIAFHFNFWLFFVKNLKNFSKNKNGNRLPYLIFGQKFSKNKNGNHLPFLIWIFFSFRNKKYLSIFQKFLKIKKLPSINQFFFLLKKPKILKTKKKGHFILIYLFSLIVKLCLIFKKVIDLKKK